MSFSSISPVTAQKNLSTATNTTLLIFLLAVPFDNAIMHFANAFLLILTLLSFEHIRPAMIKESILRNGKVNLAFVAVVAIMVLSNMLNDGDRDAWHHFMIFSCRYWGLFLVLGYFMHIKAISLRNLLIFMVISISFQWLQALLEITSVLNSHNLRLDGATSNPNILGLYLSMGVVILTCTIFGPMKQNKRALILGTAMITLLFVGLLFTGSRASWLATLVGLACIVIFDLRTQSRFFVPVCLALIGLAAYILTQFPGPAERLAQLLQGNSTNRLALWETAKDLFLAKPLFGYGLHHHPVLQAAFNMRSTGTTFYSAHNVFIGIVLSTGLVGLFAYCFLLGQVGWTALVQKRRLALYCFITLIVHGMFGFDGIIDSHFMTALMLSMLFCLTDPIEKNEPQANSQQK